MSITLTDCYKFETVNPVIRRGNFDYFDYILLITKYKLTKNINTGQATNDEIGVLVERINNKFNKLVIKRLLLDHYMTTDKKCDTLAEKAIHEITKNLSISCMLNISNHIKRHNITDNNKVFDDIFDIVVNKHNILILMYHLGLEITSDMLNKLKPFLNKEQQELIECKPITPPENEDVLARMIMHRYIRPGDISRIPHTIRTSKIPNIAVKMYKHSKINSRMFKYAYVKYKS